MKDLNLRLAIRSIVITFLCIYSSVALAQVQTPKYSVTIPGTNQCKGYYEYLPQGYSSGTDKYPLLIFIHGLGELGDGSSSQLSRVLANGTPKQINQGIFPTSFTVGGQTFKFIVISPQFVNWPGPNDVEAIIKYAIQNYRVDESRIYLTGLSMGGGVVWEYAGNNATYAKRIAAIVPISGASYPDVTRSNTIAAANVSVWATTNSDDPTVDETQTIGYVTNINKAPILPNPLAKLTVFQATGHDAWTKTYDLNFRENNMNVYQWMLQYKRSTTTTNQAPTANAGADQTITLPTSSITLNGSGADSDGSIASYSWTKVSGPTSGTIVSASAATTTINSLAAGTYTFRLTVTDNGGLTKTDDVNVTVNAAASTNKAPTVNAGADQTITLPTSSVTLTGTASDADGTIKTYAWSKVSGPSSGTIVSASAASTVVNSLVAGSYTYRLTVTDNAGSVTTDDVNVTVNAAASSGTTSGKKIRVNLYDAGVTYANSQWNNWNIATVLTNLTSSTFKYEDGTASTANAILSAQARTGDNGTNYAANATVCPKEVLRFTSLHCVDRTLTIQGLKAGAKYGFEFYASRAFEGQGSIFKIGSVADTVTTDYNANDYAKLSNIVADSKGAITVTIRSTALWNYLSGFTIIEQTTTAAKGISAETLQATATNTSTDFDVTVYPNPVQSVLQVTANTVVTNQPVSMSLINADGKTMYQLQSAFTNNATQQINMSSFKDGLYILNVNVGGKNIAKQVIKASGK